MKISSQGEILQLLQQLGPYHQIASFLLVSFVLHKKCEKVVTGKVSAPWQIRIIH